MKKRASIIFPHQLFDKHEILKQKGKVYLVEEYLFFREFKFHKTKLAFHRATMKAYEAYLKSKKIDVHYISSTDKNSDIRILIKMLSKDKVTELHYINPTDNWLEKRLKATAEKYDISLIEYENPLFINTREDLKTFFKPTKKKFFQTSFYKGERKRLNVLVDEANEPYGGKWTYDIDNRKKYPKDKIPPTWPELKTSKHWTESLKYVNEHFSDNPGELKTDRPYPINHIESEAWLKQFFVERFHDFGAYEDAIVKEEKLLNHSLLSPLINVGLLKPKDVVDKAIHYANENDIPINSLEGFVRQIIGWREFIRGMYVAKGTESRTSNYFNHKRKIPASFYDGTTGIIPVDDTIKKVLQEGYTHHIERLMIMGNFMMLCEINPKEVYRWFMELYIDAYDWVMVPNVYGMSQFADGGFFATKPYISGSNYVLKMSNYSKGPWQKTWDGLFWRFMDIHRDFFLKNPRLSMLVRTFDKMPDEKRTTHHDNAQKFLDKLG
ncbi:cryptochrome/photolyase family protein [Saprospiraceae bacterium]|nr:cryptochrome/photolyase family protein [Saprospiraceae bacterium]